MAVEMYMGYRNCKKEPDSMLLPWINYASPGWGDWQAQRMNDWSRRSTKLFFQRFSCHLIKVATGGASKIVIDIGG